MAEPEVTNGESTEAVQEKAPESGEVPAEPKKKMWAVRDFQYDGAGRLEEMLNELDDNGYDVYEMSFERQLVVAKRKESDLPFGLGKPLELRPARVMSLAELLAMRGQHPGPPPQEPPQPPPEESTPGFEIKGMHTARLFNQLNYIINLSGMGDTQTEKRVLESINTIFKVSVPRSEIEKSLADIDAYHAWHKQQRNGEECAADCLLEKVFSISKERLAAHLAAGHVN